MEFGTETLRRGRSRMLELPLRNFTSRALIGKSQSLRWGVGAFNDPTWRLSQMEELKHEEGTEEAITELESLMRGQHIVHNSSDNLRISGPSMVE